MCKFWILDFGFRILDFGFRILDFGTTFGFGIREEYCARRPGLADYLRFAKHCQVL